MKKLVVLGFSVVLCWQTALAQRKLCTDAQEDQAEREAAKLRTWDALYHSYRRYAHCDDGAIAEGYDESVARILLDHWDLLSRLAILSEKDKQFKSFVLRHVGVTTTLGTSEAKKLRIKAALHCPVGQSQLCADLRRKLEDGLSHNASAGPECPPLTPVHKDRELCVVGNMR